MCATNCAAINLHIGVVHHHNAMSLEHEELIMDKMTAGETPEAKLTAEEKKLQSVLQAKQQLMADQSRAFLEDLFEQNSTIPVKIKNVQVYNGQYFRDAFLKRQLQPLLDDDLLTLSQFLERIDATYKRLVKQDVLENCVVGLHVLPKTAWANRSPLTIDMVPVFNVVPQKRFYAKTGTNVGNGEGDGYIQFQFKNVFGGAENVMFDAVTGTKTPSSYLFNYSQPVNHNADYLSDTLFFVNTRKLDWIQSSVNTKGLTTKLSSRYDSKVNFDVSLENCWRQLSNHGSRSLEVITQLKNTFKSAVLFNVKYDSRDHHILPSVGSYARIGLEKCGLFSFNNVHFTKLVWEGQVAHKINDNHSLLFTNKAGVLFGTNGASNVLDRYQAGGPNDVRSFALNGLGPKDNNSAVGGDYFVNGGASLISRIPRAPKDTNFKLHSFINFGKLLPRQQGEGFAAAAKKLTSEYSVSCGTGILYNHPMARFELNFVLPITAHSSDYIRKGFQYGVGISFL